jgi:two-component system nitrate/nitrite response regulator NarL
MNFLLADDHDLVRETLRFFLERFDPDVKVTEAKTFPEALDVAARVDHLDLILLDLRMPGMNRFGGLQAMRQRFPNIPIIIISGFVGRDDVIEAIQHGAAGVIPKTLGSKAMLGALRLVLAGETFVPAMVARDSLEPLNGDDASDPGEDGPLSALTAREREVLKFLTSGLTNKAIGEKLGIQEVTVKLHLRGVFRKFHVSNRTQAVRLAIQSGWVS